MRKLQWLLPAVVGLASITLPSVAHGQGTGTPPCATGSANCHFVGAGSQTQFTTSALAADELASKSLPGGFCAFHYTGLHAGNVLDNRDPLGRISPETGNLWVVWIAAQDGPSCAASLGGTNVTDIWVNVRVDSSIAVRSFLATEPGGSSGIPGAQLQVVTGIAAGNLISPASLWTDGNPDVALPGAVASAIGTDSLGGNDVHINVALTDLRPEDALFAVTRAMQTLNTTNYSGLGYKGPTVNIGFPIHSSQSTATSTPIRFSLTGNDPFTGEPVRTFSTIPVGAGPLVFVLNNGGSFNVSAQNLITGINNLGTAAGPYSLANLFDGTTSCSTSNAAFGGTGSQNLNLLLRDPLSGPMNVAEFSLFRTTGNMNDSQETGVINPSRSPYNPLKLACASGGSRLRVIGNDEAVNTIMTSSNSLGYIEFSFSDAGNLGGAGFQYLTLDGVDPLTIPGTTNQQLPSCAGTACPSSLWTSGLSFPNLRNGQYKAWSMYRWLVDPGTAGDAFGPQVLAQTAQDLVDSTVADFVPFAVSTGSDGLGVYRSHFSRSGVTCPPGSSCNGSASAPNALDGGNSLGGGLEAGGDVGGLIIGWDSGTVTTVNFGILGKVTRTGGRPFGFSTGTPVNLSALVGQTIIINGARFTIAAVSSQNMLYTLGNPGANTNVPYSIYVPPVPAGVLGKKQ